MSSTRHAEEGSPLRQERYASSAELNRGLMANLVARRCSVLTDPLDRELIWFLQYLSHERGLKRLADELLELHPEQIGTASMHKFGLIGTYGVDQVRAIRREIPHAHDPFAWDERRARLAEEAAHARMLGDMSEREPDRDALDYKPKPVVAKRFIELCHSAAGALHEYLCELCLDPKVSVDVGPWYMPNLISLLRAFMAEWELEHAARIVSTEVSRRVIGMLDYSLKTRRLTLTEGIEGLGKTHTAMNFCLQRPGRVRYVQVPGTDDESGFYREIAKSLGVSINLNSKARELRERIEDVLQAGDLLIVIDEAHWLFGVNGTRGGLPKRILWVLTALINKGVPVAFVATPQWTENREFIAEHTRWRVAQLDGRIDQREDLPAVLADDELAAVVRANLPTADDDSVTSITTVAKNSERCLGVLSAIVEIAKFIASSNGRTQPNRADIQAATQKKIGSKTPTKTPPHGQAKPPTAPALPACGNRPAASLPPRRAIATEIEA